MKKLLITGLLFFTACRSTESVHSFAKTAAAGIAEIPVPLPAFADLCALTSPEAIAHYTDTSIFARTPRHIQHCPEYRNADSLVKVINQTLTNYFSLLTKTSDQKLIAYNARDLVNSLAEIQPQVMPALSLTDEKISAVKGLLNFLLNEPLKWYRRNRLQKILKQNDSAVARVIGAYAFILDTALSGEIDQTMENYRSFVYAPLYEWCRSPVEKQLVNRQYLDFLQPLETDRKKIHQAVQMLKLIRKDHYLLAFGKPPAGFAYTEHEISDDIILMNRLIIEIIQLIQ